MKGCRTQIRPRQVILTGRGLCPPPTAIGAKPVDRSGIRRRGEGRCLIASQILNRRLWRCRPRQSLAGFTLIELLVVVAIIALLVAILLPSLKEAREQARVAVCQSNLHQLSVGFYTYVEDARGFLPPMAYARSFGDYHYPPFWYEVVSPYLGHRPIDRFGYNGPVQIGSFGNEVGAKGYMACPSHPRAEPPAPGTPPPNYRYTPQTYGINYSTVFAYRAPKELIPNPNLAAYHWTGSAKLEKIPGGVYMVADYAGGCGWYRCATGTCTEIYNPLAGSWGLTYDSDGDGIADARTPSYFYGCPAYNGFNPIHNRTADCLFADGAVLRIRGTSWAQNEGAMRGDGVHTGVPNPYR